MFELLRPPETPNVLFLGGFRIDEAEDSPFFQEWKVLPQRTRSGDSDRTDPGWSAEQRSMRVIGDRKRIGTDNETVRRRAEQLADETGGNPFLLSELIGCFDIGTESFAPLPIHDVIAQRLERLPDDATRLLEIIAVSGQALKVAEASGAGGYDHPLHTVVGQMRSERLVRLIGGEERAIVDTYHDRIRESVLAQMPAERRRELHCRLAEEIEKEESLSEEEVDSLMASAEEPDEAPRPKARVFDLAYHYDGAGIRRKAWAYGLYAAEQAKRQSALEVAAEQYAIADRNLDKPPEELRFRLDAGWGRTLMLLARYDDAENSTAKRLWVVR